MSDETDEVFRATKPTAGDATYVYKAVLDRSLARHCGRLLPAWFRLA